MWTICRKVSGRARLTSAKSGLELMALPSFNEVKPRKSILAVAGSSFPA